ISQVSANPILLRFLAFNPTGSANPGQLNVMLNGKTVANLHLTTNKFVSFSFDITSLVQSSNTLVFTNPDSHAEVVAYITVIQGSAVFLNITGTRGVPSTHSVTFTFSNTPLKLVDRKSTRLNSSHQIISYAVFCLKKKT